MRLGAAANLFVEAGLVKSRGEARRKAAEGALSINGLRIDETLVDEPFATDAETLLLRFGKKRYMRIKFEPAS
ncbi:MAG: hypothetical protein KC432_13185 [Thermomicrobiales bacterium]|nr:hypothetical protein [Thermomicrobiales bacterium]